MKVEPIYLNEVLYLNNSPHVVRVYTLNAQGEKVKIGEKIYKPVTGNMPEDQWNKLFHGTGTF